MGAGCLRSKIRTGAEPQGRNPVAHGVSRGDQEADPLASVALLCRARSRGTTGQLKIQNGTLVPRACARGYSTCAATRLQGLSLDSFLFYCPFLVPKARSPTSSRCLPGLAHFPALFTPHSEVVKAILGARASSPAVREVAYDLGAGRMPALRSQALLATSRRLGHTRP